MSIQHGNGIERFKKKKISFAVKIGLAVKKNYDDLVVKKESDFPKKKIYGVALAS